MEAGSKPKRAPDPEVRHFGHRVRERRTAQMLTQEELAERAGLHRTLIGHIETGTREIGISKVWPLARALGVTPADLFGEDWSLPNT